MGGTARKQDGNGFQSGNFPWPVSRAPALNKYIYGIRNDLETVWKRFVVR